jgi:NodT family efflux transporter outer membrane factor (OMF) lipoprotein
MVNVFIERTMIVSAAAAIIMVLARVGAYVLLPVLRNLLVAVGRILAAVLVPALLSACAVGPDFLRPSVPQAAGYTPEKLAPQTAAADIHGGEAQRFVGDLDIPGQWWTLFHSQALTALVAQAIEANPSLDAAKAALREAQENVYAEQGALFPTVGATVSTEREKAGVAGFPGASSIFSVHTADLSVSYPVDVFGGTRRQIEELVAQADDERFQLEAAYLTLTANVVTAAVTEASLRGQIAATMEIIEIETQELEVLQRQLALGGATKSAVLQQAATLAQERATLPVLQKQLAQERNLLADLAGRFPSQEVGETFELDGLELPQDLPVSLPSRLIEQRPDVRSSEALLHASSAAIGVAIANQLPQLTLSATFGSSSSGALFSPGTGIWSAAASLSQTLFDAGALQHKKLAVVAAYDQSAAQYRSTVLAAFEDVANALRALQSDADALRAQLAAERAAADSLALAREQYRAGGIPYLSLLTAEQTYQQARISLVQAQASRFADTAALFQALGGGWWNRSDVPSENGAPRRLLDFFVP